LSELQNLPIAIQEEILIAQNLPDKKPRGRPKAVTGKIPTKPKTTTKTTTTKTTTMTKTTTTKAKTVNLKEAKPKIPRAAKPKKKEDE